MLPFSTYNEGTRYVVDERALPEPGREPVTDYRVITPDYFKALEIPLTAGRTFDSRDRDTTERVAIVNRTLARQAFGNADPIGKRVRLGRRTSTGRGSPSSASSAT